MSDENRVNELETQVLQEYSSIAQTMKRFNQVCKELSHNPNEQLLQQLRQLEQKMGLVLTLYKASVWSVIMDEQQQQQQQQ
ncbi:hypothetical protein E3Q22_01939 [Wallemia mellicola]|uniref:DASH complex subunit DAD3 n=2 Tax=Wallemia mellicola TaxID=1708541 RepID=A0A4T0SN70_9BASI|nr:DASH complex, subunit Dad3 [Wallemia mellicola CBS 633.66]TIB73481.1 hypothetical protein E3Q23_03005 [Wallemia mellicola]EIM23649.1 DASH complex, subunit Dad3 [Wallemia mellicola CBS 633.66]TIB73592.1 hypothetical protein E3Q24_01009 [Wallemia mellicola]TIB80450.1 hypothetical protein E3Q22_01939 [Wallemia mellicola]TIB89338.1 hypothetical protein E3Q19_03068 [Wallemia mellicola]|eukprot:XP_006956317.1 DASH complex, subunit Dad3 [Wallemia mellicola CBS 633.66]